MALQSQIQDLDRQIVDITNQAPTARQQAVDKIKADRGYEQQQKSVNDLKRAALDTEKMISSLPQDVKRRTAGRLVTNAQANRITAAQQAPLTQSYADQTRTLGYQQEGLRDIENAAARTGDEARLDTQARIAALEGQRGSLFNQWQIEQQRAAQAAALAEQRRQQEAQVRALELLQKQSRDAQNKYNFQNGGALTGGEGGAYGVDGVVTPDTSLGGQLKQIANSVTGYIRTPLNKSNAAVDLLPLQGSLPGPLTIPYGAIQALRAAETVRNRK